MGGAMLRTTLNTTISYLTVASSDNPYGIFNLAGPGDITTDEGSVLNFAIGRMKGDLWKVVLRYEVTKNESWSNDDILPASGSKGLNSK